MARIKEILHLNPRDLEPDPHNSRTDIGDLVGLAETIREYGVLQPLGVASNGDAYRIVYGNRRREAAIVVGLDTVPCLLLDEQSDTDRLLCQLLENIQRKSLNDMEQGRAFRRLREEVAQRSPKGTSEKALNEVVAKRLGLSPRTIQRYVSLCDLPPAVQDLLLREEITVTHAQHLHALKDDYRRTEVAHLAAEEGMSAAELARLCSGLARNPNIAVEDAVARLRQGQPIDAIAGEAEAVAVAGRLPRAPKVKDEDDDSDLWEDEGAEEEEDAPPPLAATADGNRRYRVRG
ncbi:MAG: ParB/RepB/Spo0J family partition protein, partial [Chloroflexota bacterium]